MPVAARSEGNRRIYDADDVSRLRLIRHARELGFEVQAIRQLLELTAFMKHLYLSARWRMHSVSS